MLRSYLLPPYNHPKSKQSQLQSLHSTYTMSLADALLADLDGLSDDEGGGPSRSPSPPPAKTAKAGGSMLPPPLPSKKRPLEEELMDDGDEDVEMEGGAVPAGYVPEGGVKPAEELDEEEVEKVDLSDVTDVGKVAKLHTGKRLKEVLEVSNSACNEFKERWKSGSREIRPLGELRSHSLLYPFYRPYTELG